MQECSDITFGLSEEADPRLGPQPRAGAVAVRLLQTDSDVLLSGSLHGGGLQHLLDVPDLNDVVLRDGGQQLTARVQV